MNVPSSRLSGNCTTKLSSVISSVSHMALRVTGSWNTVNQAVRPANDGVPRPSQAKNDSSTTPASGSRAKMPKKLSAGSSSQLLGPVFRRFFPRSEGPTVPWPAGSPDPPREASTSRDGSAACVDAAAGTRGCPAVMPRGSRSCSRRTRRAGSRPGRSARGCSAAPAPVPGPGPGPRTAGSAGAEHHVVGEGEEVLVLQAPEGVLEAGDRRDRAHGQEVVDHVVVEVELVEVLDGQLLDALVGGGGGGPVVGRVADHVGRIAGAAVLRGEVQEAQAAVGHEVRGVLLEGAVDPAALQQHRGLAGVDQGGVGARVGGDGTEIVTESSGVDQ